MSLLFCSLVELKNGFLLFIGLNGSWPQAPNLSDSISSSQALLLHQVAGQHGASAAKAQGAVHSNSLSRGNSWSPVPSRTVSCPH